MTRLLALLLVATALLGAAGCGSKDDSTASSAPAPAASGNVPSDATPEGKAAAAAVDGTGPSGH